MKLAQTIKNIIANLLFLISGISTGTALSFYLIDTFPLMDQSLVPENPIGVILIPMIAVFLSVIASLVFAGLLFRSKKCVKPSLLLFRKKDGRLCVIIRCIGYLLILRLIYDSIHELLEFKKFFLYGLWYYTSSFVLVLTGMVIILSIITKDAHATPS